MVGTAVIAGFGPGFCEELAWKLADDGYAIAIIARSEDYLINFQKELQEAGHDALAVPLDLTDADQVSEGFATIRSELGTIDVLAYTASTTTGSTGSLDPKRFETMWRLYAYGPLLCAREALDDMEGDCGTILFFGAVPETGDFAYKSGKAAARELARTLAMKYGGRGVHVAHVVIGNSILNPDVYEKYEEVDEEKFISPTQLASICSYIINQEMHAWTFETDVRSYVNDTIH